MEEVRNGEGYKVGTGDENYVVRRRRGNPRWR